MRIINAIVDALRRLFGTDKAPEIDSVEIFEDERGVWRFKSGQVTWGKYNSYAEAENAAIRYNNIKVEAQKCL